VLRRRGLLSDPPRQPGDATDVLGRHEVTTTR